MNLPEDIPGHIVCGLRNVMLPRPIVNSIELGAVCMLGAIEDVASPDLARIIPHATELEIRRAVQRIATETRRRPSVRNFGDLDFILRYLGDCPEPHAGGLGGLAERAIDWHRRMPERADVEELSDLAQIEPQTPVLPPPIPPPETPGIRFLGTVGAIVQEGARMRHCVATRAPAATRGRTFLFHVDHGGEEATLEINLHGRIEAEGPANTPNRAARWGARVIREWARGWRPAV